MGLWQEKNILGGVQLARTPQFDYSRTMVLWQEKASGGRSALVLKSLTRAMVLWQEKAGGGGGERYDTRSVTGD